MGMLSPRRLVRHEDHPEEELRQLNAVLEEAVEGISRLDPEGRYVTVNPAYARMVGYDPDEMAGMSWKTTVHPDEYARAQASYEQMKKEGRADLEIMALRKDGALFYKEVFMVAVHDKDRRFAGHYCLAKDITQRKNDERRMTAMTEGLRAVVAVADELISCPDLDTLYRRAVELAREKLHLERCAIFLEGVDRICGTYGTDLRGRTTVEHTNCFEKTEWWKNRFRSIQPHTPQWLISEDTWFDWDGVKMVPMGKGWVATTPILLSESSTRPIGVLINDAAITGASPDPARQEIISVYCSLLGNIIRRKRAEEDYARSLDREREKTEQLRLAIREAHHRIKNNLQSVSDLLYLEMASGKASPGREALQASMERIQTIALVHQLLSYDSDVRQVDMESVIHRLIPTVLTSNGLSPAEMDVRVKVPSFPVSSRQATALALILNELVSNAAKHAFPGRRNAELTVAMERERGEIILIVHDNGPGLPPDFDVVTHTHVGLEVARTLAKQDLKGQLEVRNVASGVRATLRFPLHEDTNGKAREEDRGKS
ncbi:MAG: PAS domain S-box protein [Armatimonadetes bacterium]|nr:PAS domain S-box protein [Armatimonadota bacterium]